MATIFLKTIIMESRLTRFPSEHPGNQKGTRQNNGNNGPTLNKNILTDFH